MTLPAELRAEADSWPTVHDSDRRVIALLHRAADALEWPNGLLNRAKTLQVIRDHNLWRRGADAPQTDPRMLGLALEAVVAYLTPLPPPPVDGEAQDSMNAGGG